MNLSLPGYAARAEGAPFECQLAPDCTSTFRRKADSDRHYDDIHLGKKVQCPVEVCPQQVRKDKLRSHLREKHPGHPNPRARRSGSAYLASNNNSDSPNGNPTTPRQNDTPENPRTIKSYSRTETLRLVQVMECLCAHLHIDLLPGEPDLDDQLSNPSSILNDFDSRIKREVLHFVATRLSPYPASYPLAQPQHTSMGATRGLMPSSMPCDTAYSITEIPVSFFGGAQAVPVRRSALGQEYSYGSQVVPFPINEPPTVTTSHSTSHVATDQSNDITARCIPPNLGHNLYTPPDYDSAYLSPSMVMGFGQIRGDSGEHSPPDHHYNYTDAFNSANLNTGDSLPYQDEMYPLLSSTETSPSNTDPRPYIARPSS